MVIILNMKVRSVGFILGIFTIVTCIVYGTELPTHSDHSVGRRGGGKLCFLTEFFGVSFYAAFYWIKSFQNRLNLKIVAADTYYLEKRCPLINRIMDVEECEVACDRLGIPLSGKLFKDGKPCFRGGNGVCNQNGAHGGRSNFVCKHEGKHFITKYEHAY